LGISVFLFAFGHVVGFEFPDCLLTFWFSCFCCSGGERLGEFGAGVTLWGFSKPSGR
jgi:hypothetical protein